MINNHAGACHELSWGEHLISLTSPITQFRSCLCSYPEPRSLGLISTPDVTLLCRIQPIRRCITQESVVMQSLFYLEGVTALAEDAFAQMLSSPPYIKS